VVLNGESKRMSGLEIYKYCIEHAHKVPEHFQYCKAIFDQEILTNMIKDNDLTGFKSNYTRTGQNGTSYLYTACKYNKIEFVEFLVEECKLNVTIHDLVSCCHKDTPLELFKYLINPRKQKAALFTELLYRFVHTNNLPVVKYIIEQFGISLHDCMDHKPLIGLVRIMSPSDSLDLVNYLIEKSKEQRVRYGGSDLAIINKKGLLDKFEEYGIV
jgi:hypothetical protein